MNDPIDLYSPASPGGLNRSIKIDQAGAFRIARRDAELYSVEVVSAGAWGRVKVSDGSGRMIFYQPSCFTGSFVLGAGCEGGIIVEIYTIDLGCNVTVNYRERDQQMV